ncbi:M43 family zinc metalloprotease [Arundinibacter roseus]|nr:M43 family zinc metalloprotease [Arundinibacter roseus]
MKRPKSKSAQYLSGIYLLLFLASFQAVAQTNEGFIQRCGSFERDQLLKTTDPQWKTKRERLDSLVNQWVKSERRFRNGAIEEVIRIPVVVHVIHNQSGNTTGGLNNANISDEQIRSQLDVLNEDYRRKPGTPGFNTSPVGADAYIEFYLAEYDPDGRPTTGITRNFYTDKTSFNPYNDAELLASISYWPSEKYLNIWTCRLTNSYLGVAQFPSVEGVDGLNSIDQNKAKTDGVIIDFRNFGRNTGAITSRIYNLGRTATHEIAHWLGLIHTWGDAFCGTDYCADTPPTEEPNRTTVCIPKFSNCNGTVTRNMIENYLDYSPDSCMNVFTNDQVARMRAVLALSPRRALLVEYARESRLESTDNLTVEIYPNPADEDLTVEVRFPDFQDFTYAIFDLNGRLLYQESFTQVWSRRLSPDIRLLPPGNYLLRVQMNNETVTKRFVVN